MIGIKQSLLDCRDELFGFFEQVFLFGSTLSTDSSHDVDILLVYEDDRLVNVVFEEAKLAEKLAIRFGEQAFHLTVLNDSELEEMDFLGKVENIRIK